MSRHGLILTMELGFAANPVLALALCPGGMVQSGSTCVDRFEASLWKVANPLCDPAEQCNVSGSSAVATGQGELAGVYAIDQNGAPNSVGDASAAGFRCAR